MIPDLTLVRRLESALPAYIAKQRWFRSKASTIASVEVTHLIEAGGFLILFLTLKYSHGGSDLYLLPITSVTSPNLDELKEESIVTFYSETGNVAVYDAVFSPFFRDLLFRALAHGESFPGENVSLVAHSEITVPDQEGIRASSVSRAEQSNTSIIYGREYILKIFRKLEAGINPDIEMGAFLTSQNFKNTPAVLASLEFQSGDHSLSAGILQEFVPNQGDAWKYTLQSLQSFYLRALDAPLDNPHLLGDYVQSAQMLGVRTAQMHAALASSSTSPDFVPEAFAATDAQILSAEIAAQAGTSLSLLREKSDSLPAADQQLALKVLDLESQITRRFTALALVSTSAKRIRYHGDYHLGQVLYTGSDFMIIDFEGEPARPLSERRQKALALRDVAGMLRSFQYAAFSGTISTDPHTQEKLAACSAFWYREASKIFLDAYLEEAGAKPFLPSTPEQRTFFLDLFLLQKALYEVQYELNNRPAWVGIPLRGILSLMDA